MAASRFPRLIRLACFAVLILLVGVVSCNWWLLSSNRERVFRDIAEVPKCDVVLVLGTSPRIGASLNPFFENRMDAAAQLWRNGKVRHLILSGDNSKREYDEPSAMRDAILARGVPADAFTLDHAGFRTHDSMVRARKVFLVEKLMVVTDGWHQPRALFLAQAAGLEAVGFCSADVPFKMSAKTRIREWFSRVKAVLDIYVLRTKPRFLGDPVRLPL